MKKFYTDPFKKSMSYLTFLKMRGLDNTLDYELAYFVTSKKGRRRRSIPILNIKVRIALIPSQCPAVAGYLILLQTSS